MFVSRTTMEGLVERCQQVTTKVVMVEVFIKGINQLMFNNCLLNAHHRNCANWLLNLKRVHLIRGNSAKKRRIIWWWSWRWYIFPRGSQEEVQARSEEEGEEQDSTADGSDSNSEQVKKKRYSGRSSSYIRGRSGRAGFYCRWVRFQFITSSNSGGRSRWWVFRWKYRVRRMNKHRNEKYHESGIVILTWHFIC